MSAAGSATVHVFIDQHTGSGVPDRVESSVPGTIFELTFPSCSIVFPAGTFAPDASVRVTASFSAAFGEPVSVAYISIVSNHDGSLSWAFLPHEGTLHLHFIPTHTIHPSA